MGNQRLRLVGWIAVFVLSLVVPLVGEVLIDVGPGWVIVGMAVGAVALWNANSGYRRWIQGMRHQATERWLTIHLAGGAVAVAAVMGGAALARHASATDDPALLAIALGLAIGALVALAQIVRADNADIVERPIPVAAAVALNVALIGSATIGPSLILAPNQRGWTLGILAGLLWGLARLLQRFTVVPAGWVVIGVTLLLGPLAAARLFVDRDQRIAPIVVVAALVVMLTGAVVLAAWQDSDRELPGFSLGPFPRSLVIGAPALLLGFVWLAAAVGGEGVPLWQITIGAAAAAAFGGSLVTRGEGFLAVAVVGLVLVWTVQGHTVGPQPDLDLGLDGGDRAAYLVAFGDSYMSGEGIGRFYDNTNTPGSLDYRSTGRNECRRSPEAYTRLLAGELGLAVEFDACSGAKAISDELADRLSEQSPVDGDLDLSVEAAADYVALARADGEAERNTIIGQTLRWLDEHADGPRPDVVLVSLGGNDAGFSQIGTACFLPGSCRDALAGQGGSALAAVSARVSVALATVGATFPDAHVAVVGYPQMFEPATARCADQVPFDRGEVGALRNLIDDLNEAVSTAVAQVADGVLADRVVILDGSIDAFDGRRFCQLDRDGAPVPIGVVNTVDLQPAAAVDLVLRAYPTTWIHNTFHPTAEGHRLLADSLCTGLADVVDNATADRSEPAGVPRCDDEGEAPVEGEETIEPMAMMAEPSPPGACGDLDNYVYCSLLDSLRRVALPAGLLMLGGLYLAQGIKRHRVIPRLLRPVIGPGSPLAPVAGAVPIDLDDTGTGTGTGTSTGTVSEG